MYMYICIYIMCVFQHTSAYVSTRKHTSACVSKRLTSTSGSRRHVAGPVCRADREPQVWKVFVFAFCRIPFAIFFFQLCDF